MHTTVQHLIDAMETVAPLRLAEPWDNVGLLMGDPSRVLRGPVLLTIDLTEPVVVEAIDRGCDAVLAYHPPIFEPLKRLTDANGRERVVRRALEAGLAVYSPHTALDATPGGVTDWLADGILDPEADAGADRRALVPHERQAVGEQIKLVTFLPAGAIEQVRSGLASAGAGRIGDYELCSFAIDGTGSFQGGPDTNPTIGEAGRLETVSEQRLEMVCSRKGLALALETLRNFHPYEEPAIDVYALTPKPERSTGAGRRLVLDAPASLETIAARLKAHLKIPAVKIASAGPNPVTHVGFCPGSGGSLASTARADGCDVFVTGEMTHHHVLAALESGMSVLLTGHTSSERGYLPVLADRLAPALDPVGCLVSERDRSPFVFV